MRSIDFRGLRNTDVVLVFSNLGDRAQPLPQEMVSRGQAPAPGPPVYSPNLIDPLPGDLDTRIEPPALEKTWKVPQLGEQNVTSAPRDYPSTLRGQIRVGEFTYRLWVADQAWTAHAQKTVPALAALLFGTTSYPSVLKQYLADFSLRPWGSYPATPANEQLIEPTATVINIVLAPNGAGAIQFFDPSQVRITPHSNGELVVFAGSDMFSCQDMPQGMCFDPLDREVTFSLINNLLHELTHLIHFYHRAVLPGRPDRFDTWLEEAAASSHGYAVAMSRFPNTPAWNQEFVSWFGGNYACSLTVNQGQPGSAMQQACSQNYYKGGQAFLIYLVQRYGTGFYTALLKSTGKGLDALDESVRSLGGEGVQDEFRRWGGWLAGSEVPVATTAAKSVGEYLLPPLNLAAFAPYTQFPVTLPATIEPFSHVPFADYGQSGAYHRSVLVPPGVALTVYLREPRAK